MIDKIKNSEDFKLVSSYFVVGFASTIVEWVFFYLFDSVCHWHYQIATTIAIIISTFANWVFGRLLTFKDSTNNVFKEILEVYLASTVGLGLNLLLMYIFVEKMMIPKLISKVGATGLVFFYNYYIRKLVIYKKK